MTVSRASLLTALVGTALMAGTFFAFSTAVMGSLERMPEGQGATAMNIINARIQNPLFLTVFTVTALACLVLTVLAFVRETPGRWWQLTGALLYLAGGGVLTALVNVPLNNRLARVDPASAGADSRWQGYLHAWNPANNLRTVACTLAVLAFGLALAAGSGDSDAATSPTPTDAAATRSDS